MKSVALFLVAIATCNALLEIPLGKLKTGPADETLTDYDNLQYYGPISIGTPGQIFQAFFHTGFADTVVYSEKCGILAYPCRAHARYDNSKSSTYKVNGTNYDVDLLGGHVAGFLSTDDITISNVATKKYTFAEMTTTPMTPFGSFKCDAVVGMAFNEASASGLPTIFSQMIADKLIDKPVFAFYMSKDPKKAPGGVLTLGGADANHYNGNITYIPVNKKAKWQVELSSVMVGGNPAACTNGCNATFQTSYAYVSGHKDDITSIYHKIGATQNILTGKWTVDCSRIPDLPKLDFHFGEHAIVMQGNDYISQSGGIFNTCTPIFMCDDTNPMWRLGDAFIRKFYTVFDYGNAQVGLAEAK